MTLDEVKKRICEVTEMYFAGASVIWSGLGNTRPSPPYVTLKCGSLHRSAFPVEEDDETRRRAYQCRTVLEVNLYTKGKPVNPGGKVTVSCENTALSDISGFCNFLDSEEVTDQLSDVGIALLLMPPVRDLSFLENETQYRYRAMAEYEVSFAMEAGGAYGIGGMDVPDASGGGTKEMADTPVEPIKNVEIMTGGMEDEE